MVRVRFAPSPTGPLHIGGVRTALYNYFFALKNGGKLILRIEDTDQTRYVEGAEKYIIEGLSWSGIEFDEGPHIGGPFGPYRQSERKEIYFQYAMQLIESGNAYYAFDTAEELDAIRKEYESRKETFQYDCRSRNGLKNSLTLSQEQTKQFLDSGCNYTIRLKVPENTVVEFDDIIRGHVSVKSENIDDKVLFKSDGMPTYHLANIVDDHLMEITHVIRGEEWLPSAPLHVLLYRFLDWQAPLFAHLPLLLKPDGNGKLSKRDGDRMGFPVFPLEWTDPKTGEKSSGYRESGYFHEAFINMLALLGWNPGDEREVMSITEMSNAFSLERVSKSGAKFDPVKARWFNHQYMMKKPIDELASEFTKELKSNGIDPFDTSKMLTITQLLRERADFVKDLPASGVFFFAAPQEYNEADLKKHSTHDSASWLATLSEIFSSTKWTQENIDAAIAGFISNNSIPAGKLYNILRIAVVGSSSGPHLSDILLLLGVEETCKRMNAIISRL
ncbi:MAG: glutamate--tRNA ligase [Bacteroidetes bacterium HGW-Bacteroidetes-6]|jgi:glutamyl-tRNA synthetase|nr:MAG: glutamate--tRNA ligase [Bacteroidetes bacterium HGW-Bacteroidetes-6]